MNKSNNNISLNLLDVMLNTPTIEKGMSEEVFKRYLELIAVLIENEAKSVNDAAAIVRARKVDFEKQEYVCKN